MDKKTAGLWARADDVVRWRRDLHKLKDMATALLTDLGDMTCYRLVPEHVPDDLENQVGDFNKGFDYTLSQQNQMADEIVQRELAKAKAARAAKEDSGLDHADVPPAVTEDDKNARCPTAKPKKTRVSFKALHKKIANEHSLEVANYAVSQMSGADRNATRLKEAMENFLGTFKSQADAAHAFAEAEGELGLSSEEAVVLLQKAHHKLTDAEGRVAVWANRKKNALPNEQPPSKNDPAHKWAERVEEVNAAKKAEPKAKVKRKRKPPSQKVELPPPESAQETPEELPPLPAPDDVEQDWDDFLEEGAQK